MPKTDFGGKQVDALEIGFKSVREDWNEYNLNDGSILRIKLVLADVLRIVGEYDSEDTPVYKLKTANMMIVKSPDDLKRKRI